MRLLTRIASSRRAKSRYSGIVLGPQHFGHSSECCRTADTRPCWKASPTCPGCAEQNGGPSVIVMMGRPRRARSMHSCTPYNTPRPSPPVMCQRGGALHVDTEVLRLQVRSRLCATTLSHPPSLHRWPASSPPVFRSSAPARRLRSARAGRRRAQVGSYQSSQSASVPWLGSRCALPRSRRTRAALYSQTNTVPSSSCGASRRVS